MRTWTVRVHRFRTGFVLWAALAAGFFPVLRAYSDESLCATVKLEILQELTLERQAFDARMRINNGLPTIDLENVEIAVVFEDEDGNEVLATSDPSSTNAFFFISPDLMDNINAIDGTGTIAANTSADITWLIIPAPGAAGPYQNGTLYAVGATLRYKLGDKQEEIDVAPDTIYVRPMPRLVLDYFLPKDVYGDDGFTDPIEPPIPFSMGVRVRNQGFGAADGLKIDSGQPRIIENEQGLLADFKITGTEVDGVVETSSLLINFGTIEPADASVARWTMECSLSGQFKDFSAEFSHADELGGELTSLIEEIHTHLMVHDVQVDLPGRDDVRDFLVQDEGEYKVYESDNLEAPAVDLSGSSIFTLQSQVGTRFTYTLWVPPVAGPLYAGVPYIDWERHSIVSVIRSDGKHMKTANAWFSKQRELGTDPWEYGLNLFDVNGGDTYQIVIDDISSEPAPPVLQTIGDQVTFINDPLGLGFLVTASDPNGTIPSLTSTLIPPGASFDTQNLTQTVEGSFFWRPQPGQEGVYPIEFTASDGDLSDSERILIYVGLEGEGTNSNGIPLSLEDWGVTISNIVAETGDATAVVQWAATPGITYDLYVSDDPLLSTGSSARLEAGSIVAASHDAEWLDATLGADRMHRFYQVVLSGDEIRPDGWWGLIRRDIEPASYGFLAPPFRIDRRFEGLFGEKLAAVLSGDDNGPGDSVGDEAYLLNADGSWQIAYLDASGMWRGSAGESAEMNVPNGNGAVLIRNGTTAATVTYTGPVGNDGTQTFAVHAGWNLLAPSEGRTLSLDDMFLGADNGGPQGGLFEDTADQIILWDENGVPHQLIFAEGWGAPYDGHWLDMTTFTVPDLTVRPAQVIYYYRQPDAGEMNVSY